jgi:tRNA(Ile2)-agmatinylcytidine synthase
VKEGASPGLVVSRRAPSSRYYWQTVRSIVARGDIEDELDRIGAKRFELEGGRGVIGASAAMAWRPRDRTYEVLAYRSRARWGTPRVVDSEDAKALDSRYPSTFNNYDEASCRPAIAPHSGCPILMGIRGDDPGELVEALGSVRSEEKERWLLFLTNQGTDDHIIRRWTEMLPNRSYELRGTVMATPSTVPGGHVIVRLDAGRQGPIDCAAYEPSGAFRDTVKQLRAGDEIAVLGELRDQPRTLNIEKLLVVRLANAQRKLKNPICPFCHKSMKSVGKGGGYRCKRCRRKSDADAAVFESEHRWLLPGWYEPPVCSRRHLSMPLKRQLVSPYVRSRSP